MQNIYKSSKRIRIRWLCQDKNNGEIYMPDFHDHTGTQEKSNLNNTFYAEKGTKTFNFYFRF